MADKHVKGLAELNKFLQELPVKMEKNVLRGALRAGATQELLPEVQANLLQNGSVQSGALIASLKVGTRARAGTVTSYVKTGDPWYARFVEYGTAAHFISVQESEKPINMRLSIRRGEIIRASMTTVNRNVLKIGANFVGPTVHHPGARARPFMRPALDRSGTAAVVAAAKYMKARLQTKEGLDTSGVMLEGDEE